MRILVSVRILNYRKDGSLQSLRSFRMTSWLAGLLLDDTAVISPMTLRVMVLQDNTFRLGFFFLPLASLFFSFQSFGFSKFWQCLKSYLHLSPCSWLNSLP